MVSTELEAGHLFISGCAAPGSPRGAGNWIEMSRTGVEVAGETVGVTTRLPVGFAFVVVEGSPAAPVGRGSGLAPEIWLNKITATLASRMILTSMRERFTPFAWRRDSATRFADDDLVS